ncbi:regulator of replication initiation timing [Runella defluvii]|uniref:Regulator of replication initiation timing n=1 Tax=Runella defluvii TaxID=370973 RepID=A0A7W5ZMT3_9BACT|nr:hypothetical protein [Runella defluvii]MBB3839784.1 regulator of replication initiation timing [Runella defluvii]
MQNNNIFRLSAVLYADNNYEVNPKTTQRKIVESALLEINRQSVTIHEIIDFIQETYFLTFDYSEISKIIFKQQDEKFIIGKNSDNELLISLSPKRRQNIEPKINDKNINSFIDLFLTQNSQFQFDKSKEIIYRFLHQQFTTNIEGFKNLINTKVNNLGKINVDYGTFIKEDQLIINSFLSWENSAKDKAIFDIASYAIEYCLLTNNANSSIHLSDLKNKIFYLDTNIIYRALGINGENRKKRTNTFLKKFNQAGEELKITKITENEFKDSIKFYIDKLKKYPSRAVNPQIFEDLKSLSSIYDFYYRWRIQKINHSYELFEAYILSLYEAFKSEFSIKEDYKSPIDVSEEKTKKQISEFANSIATFKASENANSYYDSAYNDAENILWIESKRENNVKNIFEAKFFFISTDQTLRRWDYNRSSSTPIVILPSQWFSILLRYLNRTEDDFRSFVSFLNLRNNESNYNLDKLNIIISGISEITDNPVHQRYIVKVLVEKKFNELLIDDLNEDEIYSGAKQFAESILQKSVETLNETIENKQIEIKNINKENEASKLENDELRRQIALLINQDNERKVQEKKDKRNNFQKMVLKKWRRPIWIWFGVNLFAFIILGFVILYKSFWNFNLVTETFDCLSKTLLFKILLGILGVSLTTSITILILQYYNESNINAKKANIIYPKELE